MMTLRPPANKQRAVGVDRSGVHGRGLFTRGFAGLAMSFLALFSATATGQTLDYRDPNSAPPSWIQFAKLVKYRFEQWIEADEPVAARFRTYLKAHAGTSDGPPPTLTVRAWLKLDGTVERVSFAPFADRKATEDLRTILTRGNVGEAPPPEMLQPLNLRFSLNIKN